MSESLPERWLSVDPGDLHVGVASWVGAECVRVQEVTPDELAAMLETAFKHGMVDLVACEKFALDLKRAGQQSGSEFLTCQLIGVIKYLCKKNNVPYVGFFNHQHKRIYKMGWYTELTLKDKRKLPWWGAANSTGEHCKDAWCVGMWFKQQRGQGQYGV